MRVVKKYGGSSVATIKQIENIARYIKNQKNSEIVIVLSARGKTTNKLTELAKQINKNPSKREIDQLISTGENLSISQMVLMLEKLGVPAISLTGFQAGIFTNEVFGKAFITKIDTSRIESELKKGKVVVVAGFQGISPNGEITTLGRGGSDTTAVALASALNCPCEIYTDVDSVKTVSPEYHKNAKSLHKVTYDEMMEMAVSGAKVLETRCVELAKKFDVPLFLGKTLGENKELGSFILHKDYLEKMPIKNISVRDEQVKFEILNKTDNLSKVFELIQNMNLNLEMFNIFNNKISFICPKSEFKNAKKEFEKRQIFCKTMQNLAKITLVGLGMATHTNICNTLTKALKTQNIKFYALVVTEISISFLINKKDKEKAVSYLAQLFGL